MRAQLAVAFVMTATMAGCPSSQGGGGKSPQPERARDANGVPLDLRAEEVTVDEDGSCWWVPEVSCPEDSDISCNPPAPLKVECPAGVAQPGATEAGDEAPGTASDETESGAP